MSINPAGFNMGSGWNYTRPEKDNFTEELVATVLAIQEMQKRTYNPNGQGQPEFWNDGKPKFNIRMAMADEQGRLVTFTFQPASRKQRESDTGIHMALFDLTGRTTMSWLIGRTIRLRTESFDKQTGAKIEYMRGKPRPFWVELVEVTAPYELADGRPLPDEYKVPQLLCDDAAHGGRAQQPMYQPQPQQMYQPQQYQQQVRPAYQPQPQAYPQPQQYQQMPPQPQPMVPPQPQGMDPQVAQAMRQMNAQSVQPSSPYEDEIPF